MLALTGGAAGLAIELGEDERVALLVQTLGPEAIVAGGQPEEIVTAALYLACDASSFTTGSNIPVDGGL